MNFRLINPTIDPYLQTTMDCIEDESHIYGFVLQVNETFDSNKYEGLCIFGRIGSIIACAGTKANIEQLAKDDAVAYIEASRSYA
jgi:hypothetical protein